MCAAQSPLISRDRVEYPDGITVYNFTVAGNHDYYVITEGEYGQSCILVHNALFYHGTDSDSAIKSIINDGLNLARMKKAAGGAGIDNKGFSLTPDLDTAENWAKWRALERGKSPAIVGVDSDDVKHLLGKEGWTDAGEVFIDVNNFDQVKPSAFSLVK